MELKNFFAQDTSGNIIPNPTVYLYEPGTTTLVSGLEDENSDPITNPFTGTSQGQVVLAAPDGDYDMRVTGAGRDFTMRVRFVDASAGSALTLREDLAAPGGGALSGHIASGDGAVATTVQAKLREIVSSSDYASTAEFDAAKAGKVSHDAANRLRSTSFIAGDEELSGAALRDAVVVGRDVTGSTDCHAFADRTVMSGVTDSGTYGTFDATTELQGSNAQDHVYAFQNRNIYNGTGTVNNFSGFYHQPTIKNAGGIARLSGFHIRDFIKAGTTNVTINNGIYIEALENGANNFSIVSVGDVPGYHGGRFSFGFPTSSPAATEGLCWVGTTLAGVSQSGVNSRGGASSSATFQYSAFNATASLSPGSYTCQEVHGLAIRNAGVGAGATLTKQYGVSIDALTSGSEIYAFRTKVTAGTNKWNMYQEGNAANWYSGNTFHGLTATVPTAKSHYAAQTTAAGTAPIKLTNGSLMTTPETGAFEFDGTNLYFTVGGVRKTVTLV